MINGVIRVDEVRMKEMMDRRGMTIQDVADKMEMHYNAVLRIKKGANTNLDTVQKLCNALECHPFGLLVAEGYPETFCLALTIH
jgi:DNA-binding Xre family transcriptional regulator